MDGRISYLGFSPRRIPFLIIALTFGAVGVALPIAARAQAMGKAQVEAAAVVQLVPSSPMPAIQPMPHELVALADTNVTGITDGGSPKAVLSPKGEPSSASAGIKSATPALAPATQPVQPVGSGITAATQASSIESSLIRSNGSTTDTAAVGSTSNPSGTPIVKPGESSLYSRFASVGEVGGALAIVIGLILIGRVLVRRFVPGAALGSGKGVFEILARYPLAKNQSLVLVRIGSQLVVLNQTREASQSVMVIHDPVEVANIMGQIQGAKPASIQQGFSNLLANARMDLEATPPGQSDANIELGDLDSQLDEMAAAKRQLMELRKQVRSVRESMPAS